jgi:dephospho-CoA kinase
MLIIGLTGSIGMGKSTVAHHLVGRGVPVLDSDATVHSLYEGEAVAPIEAAFPGTTSNGRVDRARLSAALMKSPGGFARLEALVHPLVRAAQWRFLQAEADKGAPIAVLDIPLLFETGGDELVDISLVVSAPEQIQAERVLSRPGMTPDKLAAIRARQLPDAEKRVRADYVIDTDQPIDDTLAAVDKLFETLQSRPGGAYERWREMYK